MEEKVMHMRGRILVIDDNPDIREVVRLYLEEAGYEVLEASDGSVGLMMFEGQPMDVVITDLLMPGFGGLATIAELRRKVPTAKIIAISAGGVEVPQGDALSYAKELGATRTLAKPFRLPEILDVVEEVLSY
jgi:CheY-like chemotaxis protein